MESLFNEKTKGIIINTPHNPIGKVFTMDELQFISDLAKKWNTLVVSDEVYEWIVYEPYRHIRIGKNHELTWDRIYKYNKIISI